MDTATPLRSLIDAADAYFARLQARGADAEGAAGIAEIRRRIAAALEAPAHPIRPHSLPIVDRYLPRVLDRIVAEGQPALAAALEAAAPALGWVTYNAYDPAKIGPAFLAGHAFASLVGGSSGFPAEDFELGVFLIAPHTFYHDHHHPAPELYAPLTGPHGWRFGPGTDFEWRAAHLPVWNEPGRPHGTMTGPEPFFCLFGWTRDVTLPALTLPSDDWDAIDESLAARKGAAISG